jgi:glutamate dehydrogenase (NADP+)
MTHIKNILKKIDAECGNEKNFLQAVTEVLETIRPCLVSHDLYEKNAILERLVTPDREIKFQVAWLDDKNNMQINTGYRIQMNNALGPYKGGLRFHPSVSTDVLKFLAFEQVFKNSLTGLPIGGAKGGSDFDPKGKSDFEIMKFCTAFMTELHKYIGPRTDVPAGDIGVGAREIGYLFGTYKNITSRYEGVLTGKPFVFGGSLMRPEATGYGSVYFAQAMMETERQESIEGKICTVSGSGNVAIHTMEKLTQLGATPVTATDSKGMIYDKRGIDVELLKELKFVKRTSLSEYVKTHKEAIYTKAEDYPKGTHPVWNIPCYMAFPSATQNELNLADAKNLVKNGAQGVCEGANMPSTLDAVEYIQKHGLLFAPAKAANAGGVAVSEFEMSQNASMQRWSMEKVDDKLKETMQSICKRVAFTANKYDVAGNYVVGANIAGFKRVADAMVIEGI